MTAEEAYAKAMKARRDYVLEQIETSARNCQFETRIWHTYLYKAPEDELITDGYTVSYKEDQVTIAGARPERRDSSSRHGQLISIEWKNS